VNVITNPEIPSLNPSIESRPLDNVDVLGWQSHEGYVNISTSNVSQSSGSSSHNRGKDFFHHIYEHIIFGGSSNVIEALDQTPRDQLVME
jgi:hypothetical protein